MQTPESICPDTMTSPETGELLNRGVRPFCVSYKGAASDVDLPGYYPVGGGNGVHIGDDMRVVDQALRQLKEKADELKPQKAW